MIDDIYSNTNRLKLQFFLQQEQKMNNKLNVCQKKKYQQRENICDCNKQI